MQEWDAAIIDAERVCVVPRLSTRILALIYIKAIETHPCIIAYIAKSLALVGKGDKDDDYRTCDIAFAPFHSTHASFLLLIKVGVLQSRISYLLTALRPSSSFLAGKHRDAILRMNDLIATVPPNSIYYIVQARP